MRGASPAPRRKPPKIEVLGPAEAPLAVIRGRFRFRLLVKAAREADLQAYLRLWLAEAQSQRAMSASTSTSTLIAFL